MIEFTSGDLLKADVEGLVNPVNCVGIMGRGVALQFKTAFPENFKAYAAACARQEVQPGQMLVFKTGYLGNPKYIINFPTKRHWRGKSRMQDIESGLHALSSEIRDRGIKSVALPPLGSGLGGLNWKDVRSRIEAILGDITGVHVIVFEPRDSMSAVRKKVARVPKMTAGRAALIGLMSQYLGGLMDPFVTLLEVHKLMYFMQEAGQPLRLRYVPAPYGPYAENLRHVLREIEGYFVSGYADGGEAPNKELTLVPGAIDEARAFLAAQPETSARFERVANLVEGFETPFGLELLATVHWIVARDKADNEDDIIRRFYAWGDRKRQFSPRQIHIATDVLKRKRWVQL